MAVEHTEGDLGGAGGADGPARAEFEAVQDRIARAIFERYNRLRREQNKPVEYTRFEDQPEDLQKSCYAQAADMRRKVEAIGCEMVPKGGSGGAPVAEFTPDQVDRLARLEHERWMAERAAEGWAYADRKDEARKLSPYMVPYDELTEDVKEYDRGPVLGMLQLLWSEGIAVVPRRFESTNSV